MRYKVIEADDREKLEGRMMSAIARGWRPIGGLSVVNSHATSNWWYFQAITIDGKEKPGADDELE